MRDSRAEARKAWRRMRRAFLWHRGASAYVYYSRSEGLAALAILESLARREYEAGYRDALDHKKLGVLIDAQARRRG